MIWRRREETKNLRLFASKESFCFVHGVCSFSFALMRKKTEPKERIKAASLRLLRRTSSLSGKNSLRSNSFPLFTLRSAPTLYAAELMPDFLLCFFLKNRIRVLRILRVKRICFFAALCFFNCPENSFFPYFPPSASEKSKMNGLVRCAA